MPIDPQFNYEDKLALDKARLIARSRINDLGAYELQIQYNNIPSKLREDALEYLEANSLQLTDPEISFKVYEGEWNCIDIVYDEQRSTIRQRFKVDVGVGNLGDTDDEPDYSLQTGDLARISDGMEMYRAYYWRVSNPENYEVPSTAIEGEVWVKTANDNGDGTYDVIISKEVAQNQTALSAAQFGGITSDSDDIEVAGAGTTAVNGVYVNSGTSGGKDYWTYSSYYINWTSVDGGTWFISTDLPASSWLYKIISTSDTPPSSGWEVSGSALSPAPSLIYGGALGGPYNEETELETVADEKVFSASPSLPNEVADAVDGEIKTITNSPLENGLYRTTVTTREAKPLRVPSVEGSFFEYASDGWAFPAKALIIGRNRTYEQFKADTDLLADNIYYRNRINNVSVRVNDFGLMDYTITSNEPG